MDIKSQVKGFIASKVFRNVLIGLALFAVLLLDFRLGEIVGFRKASVSYDWAASYHRNFAGPAGGFMHDFRADPFMDAHGISGTVLSINDDSIIAKGADGAERTILVSDDTSIQCHRDILAASDLHPGDRIVVIGDPDDQGRIVARFIRVFR